MHRPDAAETSLIDRIKARIIETNGLGEVDLLRFQREAHALKTKDTANAFAALGILACLKGEIKNTRRYHETSIQYAGKSLSIHLSNYATSLQNLELYAEAVEKARAAWDADPANIMALDIIIGSSYMGGIDKDIEYYTAKWRDLVGEEHPIVSAYLELNDMRLDTEEDISKMVLAGAESALKDWESPEEDEAWRDL